MQPLFIRTDSNAEAAMALAFAAKFTPTEAFQGDRSTVTLASRWASESAQLFDYMFLWSESQSFTNASDGTHGIVWWNQMDAGDAGFARWASVDYGDNRSVSENTVQ
jgi:hypothetical protein